MVTRGLLVALALTGIVGFAAVTPYAAIVAHNDRVHYVGHLVAGQVLRLCPCTRSIGQTQIAKGMYHARSPRQIALLNATPVQVVRAGARRFVS